jgi:hypothetical protein
LIIKKEKEFATYVSTLFEQNSLLKNNFTNYDENKDKVYQKWIEDIKFKHDKEIKR